MNSDAKRAANARYREKNREKLSQKSAEYRLANAERIKQQSKKYREANRLKVRRQKRAQRYGLSVERVIELESQTHCPICGIELDHNAGHASRQAPTYDHCHESNKFRDVICGHCNRMLGFAHDSKEVLLKAVEYLEHHTHDHRDPHRYPSIGLCLEHPEAHGRFPGVFC